VFRAAQLEAVTTALTAIGITDDGLPPIVALLLMTGLAQVLAPEHALGMTTGHDTTSSSIERTIARADQTSTDPSPLSLPPHSDWVTAVSRRTGSPPCNDSPREPHHSFPTGL
jgi:hypothetical protein